MAQLKVILISDAGEELPARFYELGSSLSNLDLIEGKVEELRPVVLGDLTHDLLSREQSETSQKKGGEAIVR